MHAHILIDKGHPVHLPQASRTLRKASVAVALASAAMLGIPSAASATASGSIEHIRIVGNSLNPAGTIIIKGPFADGGTDYSRGQKDLAVFPSGSFTIHHPGGDFTFTLNPRTCIAHISGSGDYTIGGGYGIYKGVSGEGTYVFHGLATFGRAADGTCDDHSQPIAEQDIIRASGSMSL